MWNTKFFEAHKMRAKSEAIVPRNLSAHIPSSWRTRAITSILFSLLALLILASGEGKHAAHQMPIETADSLQNQGQVEQRGGANALCLPLDIPCYLGQISD